MRAVGWRRGLRWSFTADGGGGEEKLLSAMVQEHSRPVLEKTQNTLVRTNIITTEIDGRD